MSIETKVVYGAIWAACVVMAAGIGYFGDLATVVSTAVTVILACIPTILAIKSRAIERIEELSSGNRIATTNYFVSQVRQMQHEFGMKVSSVSEDLGRTSERLDAAQDKIACLSEQQEAKAPTPVTRGRRHPKTKGARHKGRRRRPYHAVDFNQDG